MAPSSHVSNDVGCCAMSAHLSDNTVFLVRSATENAGTSTTSRKTGSKTRESGDGLRVSKQNLPQGKSTHLDIPDVGRVTALHIVAEDEVSTTHKTHTHNTSAPLSSLSLSHAQTHTRTVRDEGKEKGSVGD